MRLINDAGFAQVHQQLGENFYQVDLWDPPTEELDFLPFSFYKMVYDPERNEMAFLPIKVGALRNLLSQLHYRPLGPKKPETGDVDGAPEGRKLDMVKNYSNMGKVWPASVFKKQYTGVVFWPYAPPGEVIVTPEKVLERFEGIQYEFLRAQGEGNTKKDATLKLTYPPQLFYNLWRGFRFPTTLDLYFNLFLTRVLFEDRYYSHPFHRLSTFSISTAKLVLGRLQDYLLDIICNGNKIHYDYFSRWMGWIRQNPGEKTGVVPIMVRSFTFNSSIVIDRELRTDWVRRSWEKSLGE